ncbi:MAG: TrkH family potassium uptake protein [Methanomicrobiales archaeon]|nr:TrkH family potassium uptake protein [Methanomicrobiales archaeon]
MGGKADLLFGMKRREHFAIIAHDMGGVFQLLGLACFTPFLVLLYFREWGMVVPMLSAPLTFLALGWLIARLPKSEAVPHFSVALVAVALTWLAVAVIGALPFILSLGMSWTDSIFEAMSGWTGTGYTVLVSIDAAPRTLIFWRSFMQWIGGIGVIAFGIALAGRSGLAPIRLFRAEGRPDDFMPNAVSTGRRIWGIYVVLTVFFIGLVLLSGVPVWDAVNLVMVALATGGFAPRDGAMMVYHNVWLEVLLIPVMLAGMVPFKLYFFLYSGKVRQFFRDATVRLILAMAFLGSLFVSLELWLVSGLAPTTAIRQGFFNTISGFATCGLQNADPHLWSAAPIIVVTMWMLVGGAAGSTAGGIKVNRLILGYQGLVWWFRRFFARSNVIIPLKAWGRVVNREITELEISKNMLVITLWILSIFFATLIALHIPHAGFGVEEVVFELVSAMSNVGLGLGFLTPASPLAQKWLYILLMWIGRLEIIPVIILFIGLFRGFEATVAK